MYGAVLRTCNKITPWIIYLNLVSGKPKINLLYITRWTPLVALSRLVPCGQIQYDPSERRGKCQWTLIHQKVEFVKRHSSRLLEESISVSPCILTSMMIEFSNHILYRGMRFEVPIFVKRCSRIQRQRFGKRRKSVALGATNHIDVFYHVACRE